METSFKSNQKLSLGCILGQHCYRIGTPQPRAQTVVYLRNLLLIKTMDAAPLGGRKFLRALFFCVKIVDIF
jgi:hypothetical protein